MKAYKKTFQAYWMNTDSKPKGKDKQLIQQQTRAQMKTVSAKEVSEALKNFKPAVPLSYVVSARNAAKRR